LKFSEKKLFCFLSFSSKPEDETNNPFDNLSSLIFFYQNLFVIFFTILIEETFGTIIDLPMAFNFNEVLKGLVYSS
jgi:hypothetical protein